MSDPDPRRAAADVKDEKAEKAECVVCSDDLPADHHGMQCSNEHHICAECGPGYVPSILRDMMEKGLKCPWPKCSGELLPLTFERQLNDDQRATYLAITAVREVMDGEFVKRCPKCAYFEIGLTAEGPGQFFYCRNDGKGMLGSTPCCTVSCGYCEAVVDLMTEEDSRRLTRAAFEAKLNHPERGMATHFACEALYPLYSKFLELLEEVKVPCPYCGVRGLKDGACTHMTCANCTGLWCYCCEKKLTDCDGAAPGSLSGHNKDWSSKDTRCPMYLTYIGLYTAPKNPDWPTERHEVVGHMAHLRVLKRLRRFHDEIGAAQYNLLMTRYERVRNAGYAYADVIAADPAPGPVSFKRLTGTI